jgi:hypothetical protein
VLTDPAGHPFCRCPAQAGQGQRQPESRVRDAKFAYGLEVVLDGLALRLPR